MYRSSLSAAFVLAAAIFFSASSLSRVRYDE